MGLCRGSSDYCICIFCQKSVQCTPEDKGIEWSDLLEDQDRLHGGGDLELDLEGDFQEYRRKIFQEAEVV